VTDEPPTKKPKRPSGSPGRRRREEKPLSSGEKESQRPTVSPPFDLEAFARATATAPREAAPSDRITISTPPREATPSERITVTNEIELEIARARSAEAGDPSRKQSSGALSFADSRSRSTPSPPARSAPPSDIEAAVIEAIASSNGPEITERTIEDPAAEMRERVSLGDYTGGLEMAELILAGDPSNLEAAECGENCRSVLERMFVAKIGPLDRAPVVIVPGTQMRWLSIDHRAGFVLSLIDGVSTVEMILDVSGMARLDALRILHDLMQQRIVGFR
jgi:hypothetical protein